MIYADLAQLYDEWIDYPGYPLAKDFPEAEYWERVSRARALMAAHGLDALVVTSSAVGSWFTSAREPHEWHDRCSARSAWYILTAGGDYLYMTPSGGGEHFNTTRRTTWVTHIRAIVERFEWPRYEIWDIRQMPGIFSDLGLSRGRLGFELGDGMTLGINVNDYLTLQKLMPGAEFVDGSPVYRRLLSIHTPREIEWTRLACQAGVWIHNQLPQVLRPGMDEAELAQRLTETFYARYAAPYAYHGDGYWDVRNPAAGDSNFFHTVLSDRAFRAGDVICRALSGASYQGYWGDVDRVWAIGEPPEIVRHWYRTAWECNQAMAEQIKPGNLCSDIYAAYARVIAKHGLPERKVGRVGHGLRNAGGLSVHPDAHIVLEPGMIISVEPMFGHEYGWYDIEDQYVVTARGAERLNDLAPEEIPVIPA